MNEVSRFSEETIVCGGDETAWGLPEGAICPVR